VPDQWWSNLANNLFASPCDSRRFSGYVVAKLIAYSAFVFIYAIAQRISAKALFGHGTFNACLIATLFAASFWPIMVLTNYFMIGLGDVMNSVWRDSPIAIINRLTTKDIIFLCINSVLGFVLTIYLIRKFVSMAMVTHSVGRFRAFLITLGTLIIGTPFTLVFFNPLEKIFYGYSFFP
jgi:hypothetical protein